MKKIVVRWTFGATKSRMLSSQALDLLDLSVKFAILLFKATSRNIKFIICYNNLNDYVLDEVQKISAVNGIFSMDVSDLLPNELGNEDSKNSWWKYAPPRIDEEAYEIIMDNDVIIWGIPETLKNSIEKNALVALTDAAGKYYGDYKEKIEELNNELKLNAGLIGLPPNFAIDPSEILENLPQDHFHSEQGFTALKFAKYDKLKYLIPLSEIEQLNVNMLDPEELISKCVGGHFCGCSYGHYSFWNDIYANYVKKKYEEVVRNKF